MIPEKFLARMDTLLSLILVGVGAADFFGPYVTKVSFVEDSFLSEMVEGKSLCNLP
jgi:hypothetical protein